MNILQVSTLDIGGGAEKIGLTRHYAYKARGHNSCLVVGYKKSCDPEILVIPNDAYSDPWKKLWRKIGNRVSSLAGKVRGAGRLGNFCYMLGDIRHQIHLMLGIENLNFPASFHLFDLLPQKPDVLHFQNLHGNYFDLRALPWLSQQVPVFLTLNDAWPLSGHCAHSFDCERWKTGCGQCPDLTIPPAIRRDASAYNWRRKRTIYRKSQLYISTPSHWLMQKVKQSLLAPLALESRVVHYGIDLSIFSPGDKQAARRELGIPMDGKILLFGANSIRQNRWKDYLTMRTAVSMLAEQTKNTKIYFIALGEDAPVERIGKVEIRFIPFQKDPHSVMQYFRAADIYLHAAKAEVWGLTITEAMACGTPVVATAVGGIPEQIEDGYTGFLVPPGDASAMAASVQMLLEDDALRQQMGARASVSAQRFGLERMVDTYLAWYQDILAKFSSDG